MPSESNIRDRLRDVSNELPQVQYLDNLGNVTFVGWTENPLVPITVNGSAPNRRDLTLLVKPLTVSLNRGPFTLRTGTFGASLVDLQPARPDRNNCCSSPVNQAIELGRGGSVTYEFDLAADGRIHMTRLKLYVNAGGANGSNMGAVWSWTQKRFVPCDLTYGYTLLHDPAQFVSPSGQILVKLTTHDHRKDMYLPDAHRTIQIRGRGVVS
jgi:hypothetical protein